MRRQIEKCDTLIAATKSTNAKLYNLWSRLGKGNPRIGHDVYYGKIQDYKAQLNDLKFIIKYTKELKFIEVNNEILKIKECPYNNEKAVQDRIWSTVDENNKLKHIKFYYFLPKMIRVVRHYITSKGIDIEKQFDKLTI